MPFSHATYKHCIDLGMPESLSADEQHQWLLQYFQHASRIRERVRSTLCDAIDYGIRKGKFLTREDLEAVVDGVFARPGEPAAEYFTVID